MDRTQEGLLTAAGLFVTAALVYYDHPAWATLVGLGTAYGIYDLTVNPVTQSM